MTFCIQNWLCAFPECMLGQLSSLKAVVCIITGFCVCCCNAVQVATLHSSGKANLVVVLNLLTDVRLKLQQYIFTWQEIFRTVTSNQRQCTSRFSSNSYIGSCLCLLGAQTQFISLDRELELSGKMLLSRLKNILS